jgi:hypothetical protein
MILAVGASPHELPRVECSITFLSAKDGGRGSPLPPGALSGNTYRPHLVIGDVNQRQATIAEGNRLVEDYIGIAFQDGPPVPEVGVEMVAVLTAMYFPHPMYERLKPGLTFTVREGPKVVAYGTVRRWLE